MEAYLFKSFVVLSVLFILYKEILKNEGNSQVKRFVALACVLFSVGFFLLPKLELFPVEATPLLFQEVVKTTSEVQQGVTSQLPENSLSTFMVFYLLGVLFFALRFLFGMLHLLRLYLKSERMYGWGFTVVASGKSLSPFSFFNFLFIGKDELEKENIHALILHEQVHRNQKHTIDSLFLQLLTIIHWCNPFIWLFQKEIRTQHEFLADEEVLKKGFDKLEYQKMLFEEQTGVVFQPVNNLSIKTSLKQRFKMMEKPKIQTQHSYFRAALFVPLMAMAVLLSSFSSSLSGNLLDDKAPSFKIYTASGEVDLEKGIPKDTEKLYLRALPNEANGKKYRITEVELTLVSGGLGLGTLKAGETIDLSRVSSVASKGDVLALQIKQYESKDDQDRIETITIEKGAWFNISLY